MVFENPKQACKFVSGVTKVGNYGRVNENIQGRLDSFKESRLLLFHAVDTKFIMQCEKIFEAPASVFPKILPLHFPDNDLFKITMVIMTIMVAILIILRKVTL